MPWLVSATVHPNDPKSYRKEYSRCAARHHFEFSFTVMTAGARRRDVAATATDSITESYLNDINKGIMP